MREHEKKNLIKAGVFFSLLAAVFMIFAVTISKENQFFSNKIVLKAIVPSANNLREGGTVQLKGIKAGKVFDIQIVDEDKVQLQLQVGEKYLKWIKKDSLVDISSQGLVGDKVVEIKGGSSQAAAFRPGKDILKPHPSLTLPNITEQGGEIAQRIERVLSKFELFLDQMNKDANIYSTLGNINQASARFNAIMSDMEKRKITKRMSSTLNKMDGVMSRLSEGPGTMHSLIYEEDLHERLNEIVGGASRSKVLKYFIRKALDEAPQD